MPIASRWAYFDHAAVAPLTGPAAEVLASWCDESVRDGATNWARWARGVEQTRERAAELLGAQPEEVALVPSTTAGIHLVAEGYPWRPGDNVVTLENEFPSNLYPWMNLQSRGVETRRVPLDAGQADPERILQYCDHHTRMVSVSWVGYATGWRIDLDQLVDLTHRRGLLLFVDAIQGLGVFPLDVRRTPVDFLAADGHKWLSGPEGAGLFFVQRQHLGLLRPLGVGWNSVVQRHDFSHIDLALRDEAARYEGGSQNMAGFLALGASLELLQQCGLSSDRSPIAERVLELTDLACVRLRGIGARIVSPRDGEHRSGIVSFELPGGDPYGIRKRCLQAGVVLSCRGGRLRISPHAYVNEADIDRLIDALAAAV
jgi:selenocysteine lyase/cysteine desulfurase